MKTLYVTDMDGTLLGRDSRMSERSARIISSLTDAGALITVATARTPATVVPILSHTRMALPAIVMTGASMWDWQTSSYVNPRYIQPGIACEIEAKARLHEVALFRYTLGDDGILDVYHCGAMSAKEREFVNERSCLAYKRFHLNDDSQDLKRVALFFAMGERDRIFALAEDLRCGVDCSVSCYVDIFGEDTGILEVFAPGVSKAEAVKSLACEIDADRIVVFGDNLNDIPMMQIADKAVAVGNALSEVKAIASVVIEENTADSVARYIRQDFMNNRILTGG